MKTIKQIADIFGVSKDKVKYRVRNLPENYLVNTRGITYVNDEGIEELCTFFGGKVDRVKTGEITQEVIMLLRDELEAKNRLIESQATQISDLTSALTVAQQTVAAAQALHAATVTKNLEVVTEKPREKGIFSRLFGKKAE